MAEIRTGDSPSACALFLRIVYFESGIHAEEHEIEVQPEPQSVGYGYFPEETGRVKVAVFLCGIGAYGPYISGIGKGGKLEFPEQFGAILQIKV